MVKIDGPFTVLSGDIVTMEHHSVFDWDEDGNIMLVKESSRILKIRNNGKNVTIHRLASKTTSPDSI